MAYDKVVDSSVLNAGLKTIADAIREKAGTSDSLAFPTAMAEAIAAIEAGGGGLSIASGSFKPASNVYSYEITHNLGKPPVVAAFVVQGSFSSLVAGAKLGGMAFYSDSTGKTNHYTAQFRLSGSGQTFNQTMSHSGKLESYTNPTSSASPCYAVVAYSATATTIMFGNENQSSTLFASGKNYYWVVVA